MNESLFRQKSLDKVKSPDILDDYIQVSNPGVWLLLISVLLLLAGACVWGIFGHIDSTVPAAVRVEHASVLCTVAEDAESSVQSGMTVKFDEFEAIIIGEGQGRGEYICALQSQEPVSDGMYAGKIVIKRYQPMAFVLN